MSNDGPSTHSRPISNAQLTNRNGTAADKTAAAHFDVAVDDGIRRQIRMVVDRTAVLDQSPRIDDAIIANMGTAVDDSQLADKTAFA